MRKTSVLVTVILMGIVLSVSVVNATWCNSDYDKRINVSINNTAGSALIDYQVYVNLSSNPINETSLRVYNATSCMLRPHWCQDITNGNCTKLWINYSVIGGSGWTNDTSIYSGNSSVSSTSNGTTTFNFFDDAEAGVFSNKWINVVGTGGSYSTTNKYQGTKSIANIGGGTIIASLSTGFTDAIFEAKVNSSTTSPGGYAMFNARASSSANTFYGCRFRQPSTLDAELYRFVAGSGTLLNNTPSSDNVAVWSDWKMAIHGSNITTYYNGNIRNTYTDATPITSGGIGSRGGDAATTIYLDNARIRKYASVEPSTILGSEEHQHAYNISGYVKTSLSVAIENVYVTNNKTSATNYTNASGYYVLSGSQNGTYNISGTKTGYDTNYTVAIVGGADVSNQNITLIVQVYYIPPEPTNLQNTTGNTWINWTWEAGTGNITDSYNVSVTGNNWINGSSNTYYNKTNICSGQSITISVYAFNTSASGSISDSNVTDTASVETLPWAISNYKYRAVACAQNITTGNYQVNFSLHTGVGANNETDIFMNNHNETSDYSDVRIYNASGKELSYWIENTSIDPTKLWINVTENGSVQIYYGHSGASSSSNGNNTFEFFDDFEGVESSIPNKDGAWCWFQDPRAVHYHGTYNKTYVGYVTSTGDVNIWSFNHANNDTEEYTLHGTLVADDHVSPSILIRNDGHVIVFYSTHGGDSLARYRISTNVENISAWGTEQTTTFTRAITYPTPIQLPGESNKIYLFVRQAPVSGNADWVYKTSTDGGVTWSAVQMLVQAGVYLKIISNDNDTIYFTHSNHPIAEVTSIYHFYYYNNALYKADGTKICDVPSGLPIVKTDMDLVYNATEEYKAWIWDIALDVNTPIIAFAHFVSNTDHRYDYAKWNGTGWNITEITTAGTYIDGPSQVHYSGGISIDKENPSIVYLSRQISSQWEIQKWTTTDGGSTWQTPVNITLGSSNKNLRPVVVRNHTSDFTVLWMYGSYVHYYEEYNTHILSDSPIIESSVDELDTNKWSLGVSAFSVLNGYLQVQDIDTTDGSAYLNTDGPRTINGWNPNNNILEFRHQGGTDIGSTQNIGLTGWYKNDTISYFMHFTPSSGRSWDLRLDKREDSVTTNLSVCCDSQYTQGSWYIFSLRKTDDTTLKLYQDETEKLSGTISNIDEDLKIGFQEWNMKTWRWDWIRIRKYASLLPFISLGSEEEGPATTPVISDIQNGSISSTSQYIDWDVNQTAHNRVMYSNESDLTPAWYSTWDNSTAAPNITLSALDASTQYWYQAWSYNTINNSLNANSSTLSFTTPHGVPVITLLSQYPSLLYLNSTGYFNVTYMVSHNSTGLNNSSVSFVYTNYDTDDGRYNWSLRVPANNRSEICTDMNGEKILRADNRNNSLNFENNATITGGNVYEWGGGDENTTRMSIVPVNSTHTKVYWNGTITDTVSMSMWYLDRTSQQTATMTTYDIYKNHRLCYDIWDIEAIDGHSNYLLSAYLDTHLSSGTPNKANLVYYCNDSYNPEGVVNPEDSTNCFYVTSHNATTWVDYKYNNTYIKLFTVNQSTINASVLTSKKAHICFNTEEASSKPYSVNITNSVSTTNRTFEETNTTRIGGDAPLTENLYTTNAFMLYSHVGHQHQMKLFAADNNGKWNNSTLKTTDIGFSYYSPTVPVTKYFYFDGAKDYDMNNTYNGTYDVNVLVGSDPDGGETHHNLTLHYDNQTFVAIINDSFYDVNATNSNMNISFDSSSYYSSVDNYTLRIVATDDEAKTSESWLGVNFSLQSATPILHIGDAINIKEDWGRDFDSNLSANVTSANASGVWMNFTNAEFTNTSLGWVNLTLNEWINESHNANSPVSNISVDVYLNSTTLGATNGTDSFWYEVTNRTNTATMDSAATHNANTSEIFYVNATCNEEYGDTFLGGANLLEDGVIIDTDTSVIDYVNFSHSEAVAGVYNYTVRFYNLTHYDNATTPTYSNVTVTEPTYMPPNPINLQNTSGNYWVNYTWSPGILGNVTDLYNVSWNDTWYNDTTVTYMNDSVGAGNWANITVYAYNSSGTGTLSSGSVSDEVKVSDAPPGDYIPPDPTNIQNSTGVSWVNYTWDVGGGNVTNSYNVSWNLTWYNGTTNMFMQKDVGCDKWANISVYAFNSSGTGSLSIGSVSHSVHIPDFYVPNDTSYDLMTRGNFWVNHTWSTPFYIGDNDTDSYNYSVNSTWYNGSFVLSHNNSDLSPHGWSNITIWGYNDSCNASLSNGDWSDDVQLLNNVPVLTGLPDNTTDEDANQTDIFDLDDYFTDVDGDTPTYLVESNNQSAYVDVTINASNNVSYTLASGWNGTAEIVINVTDGYGGEDNDTFLIIVNAATPSAEDYIPPNPTNVANTTGNGWVNYTWDTGTPGNITNSYNISWNSTWYNTTLVTYMNDTVGEFGWANITVYAFNTSGNGSLSAGNVTDDTKAGGGTFTTSMTTGVYNLITYYGSANSSAEQFGNDIGNTDYVARYNTVNDTFTTHVVGNGGDNFTTEHGRGYFIFVNVSGSTTYQRNNISDSLYDTSLLQGWNTIGWTNATDTNAGGVAVSIGSSCDYTSSLNADGVTYTTHTVGFTSNNHDVDKGKGYWVWVDSGVNWNRNS